MPRQRLTDTATAEARPGALGRLRRWADGRGAAAQVLGLGFLIAAVASALAAWAAPTLTPAAAAAVAAMAVALASAAWARRTGRALDAVADAAQVLTRTDASEHAQLPLLPVNAELERASIRLRRYVEHVRRERQELLARNAQLGQSLDARTNELVTLQDLSASLAGTTDQTRLMDEALYALERTLDFGSASIWSRDRREDQRQVVLMAFRSTNVDPQDPAVQRLRGTRLSRPNLERYEQIERERAPVVDNDARQSLLSWLWTLVTDDSSTSRLYRATRAWMGLPLKFRENVLGVMRVDHHEPGYFTDERVRLLNAVCSQTALALQHAQLLAREREVAVAAERNRIARELHDAVSQTLFAAQLLAGTLAQAAARLTGAEAQSIAEQSATVQQLNQGALAEMRLLLYELRPESLEQVPLPELLAKAVEALACRGGTVFETRIDPQDPLSPAVRLQVWRIAQEALSNLGRHSKATQAVVEWTAGPEAMELRIADDGCGFDPATPVPGHFGLDNMRSRAAEIGAGLELCSAAGEGTEWRLRIERKPD